MLQYSWLISHREQRDTVCTYCYELTNAGSASGIKEYSCCIRNMQVASHTTRLPLRLNSCNPFAPWFSFPAESMPCDEENYSHTETLCFPASCNPFPFHMNARMMRLKNQKEKDFWKGTATQTKGFVVDTQWKDSLVLRGNVDQNGEEKGQSWADHRNNHHQRM